MADVWFTTQKPASAVASTTATPADLTAKVSDLAQAITAFNDNPDDVAASASLQLLANGEPVTQSLAVSTNVGGIVDVLKQFDANGNLLSNSAGTSGTLQSVSTGLSANLSNPLDPVKTGILAEK